MAQNTAQGSVCVEECMHITIEIWGSGLAEDEDREGEELTAGCVESLIFYLLPTGTEHLWQ